MSAHAAWQYLHVLLFVYWLGADLGVFLASRYVARADLSLPERLRFLDLTLRIDMGPRSALILVIPVGFMLMRGLGLAPLAPSWIASIWGASLAWLALAWTLFLRAGAASALRTLDHALRVLMAGGFLALGLTSLVRGTPIEAGWLALKFVLYAVVIVIGLLLRRVIAQWAIGFRELADPSTAAAGNARIVAAQRRSTRLALTLWALVALIALLGLAKPAIA
jgi:hypothetical protein